MTSKLADWKKVTFREPPKNTKVAQGYFYDEGDFVKVVGDYKTFQIRKDHIITIEIKKKRVQNDRDS